MILNSLQLVVFDQKDLLRDGMATQCVGCLGFGGEELFLLVLISVFGCKTNIELHQAIY